MSRLKPFYDPNKSYEDNFKQGPFGSFGKGEKITWSGEPKKEFLGFKLYTDFGIPAGPLLNGEYVRAAFREGYCLPTFKTVRTGYQKSHPFPNVVAVEVGGNLSLKQAQAGIRMKKGYEVPLSITNSFAVPSPSPDEWQPDMKKAVESAGKGQVMIASFQGTNRGKGKKEFIADYVKAAELVKETGAKILEANLSCPNEGTSKLICFEVETTKKIAEGIKKKIGNIPLILKLSYFEDQILLTELVDAVGDIVQGLVVINTIPAKVLRADGSQALPGEGRLISGVCGKAIGWAGLDMVKRLKVLREENNMKFAIVGVGGVMNKQDYLEYKQVGADAVMSATGAMWNKNLGREIIGG